MRLWKCWTGGIKPHKSDSISISNCVDFCCSNIELQTIQNRATDDPEKKKLKIKILFVILFPCFNANWRKKNL